MSKHALLAEAFSFSPPLSYGSQSSGNHSYDVSGPLNDGWSYCLRAFRDGAQVTSSGTYVSATSGHANGVGIFFPSEGIVPDRYELIGAPPGNSVGVIASFDATPRGGGKHRLTRESSFYADSFNRADNSATVGGSGWSVHNRDSSAVAAVWGISGNQAVCTAMPSSGGGIQEAMLLHDASSGDFTMTINLGPFFDGANAGASISAFRVGVDQDDGANGLGFWLLRNDMLVRLRSNEGGSTSVSLAERPVAGDTVKIVAVGDNIKVYRNNTQIAEVTDAYNMTKTWHGLASYMPSYDHFTFDGVTIDTVAYGGQHAFFVQLLGVNDTFDRADTISTANLLPTNASDFESGTPAGWSAEPDPTYGTVYTVLRADNSHAAFGSYSLNADASAAVGRYFSTASGTSGMPVQPGEELKISSWVWRHDSSGQSRIQVNVRWYDAAGALISVTPGALFAPTVDSWVSVTWQPTAGGYIAPPNAAYAQLYVLCSSANSTAIQFWFDRWVVNKVLANVTRRSDGGLWTPGGDVTYSISGNKLIRTAPDGGFYTYARAWLYADTNYDSATMAITLVLSETSPYYGDARIFFCTNPSESAGFYFNYLAGFMEIRRCDTGATVVGKASGVPNMTDGADHTVLIKYNAATAQLTLTIDGTLYFDKITSGIPVSTGIALFMDRKFSDSGQAYSSISTSHTL